jgi:hypothetical protein
MSKNNKIIIIGASKKYHLSKIKNSYKTPKIK